MSRIPRRVGTIFGGGAIASGTAELTRDVRAGAPLPVVLGRVIGWGDKFAGELTMPLERVAISRVLGMIEAALVAAIEVKDMPKNFGNDELLTVAETAAMLRISRKSVLMWSSTGRLPGAIRYRKGGRVLFRRLVVSAWIAERERQVL